MTYSETAQKIDKTKVIQTSGSLVQVKSIVEVFCNTFDLH